MYGFELVLLEIHELLFDIFCLNDGVRVRVVPTGEGTSNSLAEGLKIVFLGNIMVCFFYSLLFLQCSGYQR